MELKIYCDCGQHYVFDVEPEDGRMPVPSLCPACGADNTKRANNLITNKLTEASGSSASRAAAPAPGASGSGVRDSKPAAREKSHSTASISRGAAAKVPDELIKPKTARPRPATDRNKATLGALLGAAAVTGVWFGLWKWTGNSWDVLALGAGSSAGLLARKLGRSSGQRMAAVVLLIAAAFILGFESYRLHTELTAHIRDSNAKLDRMFNAELAQAKEIVEAVPNGTEEEIRAFLIKRAQGKAKSGEAIVIKPTQVEDFRNEDLPRAKDQIEKQTREVFRKRYATMFPPLPETFFERMRWWGEALGTFGAVFVVLGLAAAYQLGFGEG
ncbi:MAG: hypothetical protein HY301_16595 [Verrucomicrobia bacterium]|nr:hypothetical protein [Verrucomicrobiota bacterium]